MNIFLSEQLKKLRKEKGEHTRRVGYASWNYHPSCFKVGT